MSAFANRPLPSVAEYRAQLSLLPDHRVKLMMFLYASVGLTRGLLYGNRAMVEDVKNLARDIIGPTAAKIWEEIDAGRAATYFNLLPHDYIRDVHKYFRGLRPDDIGRLPVILVTLANTFKEIGTRLQHGDQEYLDFAIEVNLKATTLLEEKCEEWTSTVYSSAVMYHTRFCQRGREDDLNKALEVSVIALEAMSEEHRHLEGCLNMLASINGQLYERQQELRYLSEGLRLSKAALDSRGKTGKTTSEVIKLLLARSNLLGLDSIRASKKESLDEAMHCLGEAMALKPTDRSLRARLSFSMGKRHLERFRELNNVCEIDLIESLKHHHRAVQLLSPDDSSYSQFLQGLAMVHLEKYKRFLEWADLITTFRLAEQTSIAAERLQGPRADVFIQLALVLQSVFEATGESSKMNGCIHLYEQAISLSEAPLITRTFAATFAGAAHFLQGNMGEARKVFFSAVDFLEQLNGQILSRDDQQFVLKAYGGLSATTAAITLEAGGEPWEALQVLERGRGSILNISLDRRADLLELREQSPALYREYMALRSLVSLDTSSQNTTEGSELGTSGALLAIMKSQKEKAELEKKIEAELGIRLSRQLNSPEEFQWLAEPGPIVAFNATGFRCDAFIVTPQGVKAIRLPDVRYEELETYARLLDGPDAIVEGSESDRSSRNEKLQHFLKWLWKKAVRPVLQELNLLSPDPLDDLPRIWWVTSGLLGLAPLHAAGLPAKRGENTFDNVVSSYAPTLKALSEARKKSSNVLLHDRNALIVTMPETKGYASLETSRDIEAISRGLRSAGRPDPEVLETPSKAQVLQKLCKSNTVYFSCHGEVDQMDPANSGLLLKPGPDTNPERLTFRYLARHNNDSAKVACLLACCTAKNEDEHLIDEMLHIVTGFQLAGFPHVIGSMWPVDDEIAIALSEAFTERISKIDGDDDAITRALHDSVNAKRRMGARKVSGDVLGWAPFVHFGC
jgi:tetratricopeptide (TPR) repeat protein